MQQIAAKSVVEKQNRIKQKTLILIASTIYFFRTSEACFYSLNDF